MDEAWEEDGVSYEKDWGVIADEIPDAIFRVEFDGEAENQTRIKRRLVVREKH